MEEIVHVFIFVGSLQAFFFGTLILTKSKKRATDFWFLALLLTMGLSQLLHYLRWEGYLELYIPSLLRVRFLFPAFIGPLFFLFTQTLSGQVISKRKLFLSLLPGVVSIVLLAPYLMLPAVVKVDLTFMSFSPNAYYLHYAISRVSLLVFSFLAYQGLVQKPDEKLSWLRNISFTMIIHAVVLAGITITDFFLFEITSYYYINLMNTTLIFVIGFFTLRSSRLFTDARNVEQINSIKYERSSLSENGAEALLNEMEKLMKEQKRFRVQGISQAIIAEELNTSTNHLSQALNQIRGQKFNDYLNSYRVADFQAKAEEQEYQHFTLLAIAESCGFGSKASFNTVFKNATGQTPTKYLKEKGSVLQE